MHSHAWKMWQRKHSEYPELSLGGKEPQVPGQIPGPVFEALKGEVADLGPKTKYSKKT